LKIPEVSKKENIKHQNLWGIVKAMFRGKLTVINLTLTKSKISNKYSSFDPRKRRSKLNLKKAKKKEITKIRVEIK
jgi:hypothetical protein